MFRFYIQKFILFVVLVISWVFVRAEDNSTQIFMSAREKSAVSFALKSFLARNAMQPFIFDQLVDSYRAEAMIRPRIVKVNSFEEFLKLETGEALFSQTDLQHLDNEKLLKSLAKIKYVSDSPRVNRQIERYYAELLNSRLKMVGRAAQISLDFMLAQGHLSADSLKQYIRDSINEKIQNFTSELNEQNSKHVMLLSKLLKLYFKSLPSEQKVQILFKLMELPLNAKPLDIFQIMIQNSGPQMQKLLQIVGRHKDIPNGFKEVFQKLESQVQKVPWPQVEELLDSEGIRLEDFTYFERRPIGVGTMAQTHRVQYVDENGNRVSSVFRFLKPGIEDLLEMDHQILLKIADELDRDPELRKLKVSSIEKIVEDLHRSVVEELHINKTVSNQEAGRNFYSESDWIRYSGVWQRIEFIVPKAQLRGKNKKIMEQELVFGSKVSKETKTYYDLYPDMYPAIAERIAEHWLEKVLFGSGFFHADLHQGNLMVLFTDQKIKVSILDFGMVGQLSQQQRESAMLLSLGVKFNYPEVIAKHLNLLSKTQLEGKAYDEFLAAVSYRSAELSQHPEQPSNIDSWVVWSLEKGLNLNYEFLKLNRGMTAIETLLMESKSSVDLQRIAEKLVMKNKTQFAKIILRENLFKFRDFAALLKMGALAVFGSDSLQSPRAVRCEALLN